MHTYESNDRNFWLLKQDKTNPFVPILRKKGYLSIDLQFKSIRSAHHIKSNDIILLPDENKTVSIFEIIEPPVPLQNIWGSIGGKNVILDMNENMHVIKSTVLKEYIDIFEFKEDSFETLFKINLRLVNLNEYANNIQRVINDNSVSTSSAMLLKSLTETDDISDFISKNKNMFYTCDPIYYINDLARKKGLKKSIIGKLSGQGDYVYKIFQGSKQPSRDVLIALSVGMKMELTEVQTLLRLSKMALLDPKEKRDSIIIFGIINCLPIDELNNLLYDNKEITLT